MESTRSGCTITRGGEKTHPLKRESLRMQVKTKERELKLEVSAELGKILSLYQLMVANRIRLASVVISIGFIFIGS